MRYHAPSCASVIEGDQDEEPKPGRQADQPRGGQEEKEIAEKGRGDSGFCSLCMFCKKRRVHSLVADLDSI